MIEDINISADSIGLENIGYNNGVTDSNNDIRDKYNHLMRWDGIDTVKMITPSRRKKYCIMSDSKTANLLLSP